MARPKNPNAENIDALFAQAEQEEQSRQNTEQSEPKKRGRKPASTKTPILNKDALASLFETANFGAIMMGQGEYALTPPEVAQLTDSWYEVLLLYPRAAKMLISGNQWLVWGGAISCTYMVVSKRIEYYNQKSYVVKSQNPPGPTLHHNGNERNGQDDVSQTADVFETVSDSPGF